MKVLKLFCFVTFIISSFARLKDSRKIVLTARAIDEVLKSGVYDEIYRIRFINFVSENRNNQKLVNEIFRIRKSSNPLIIIEKHIKKAKKKVWLMRSSIMVFGSVEDFKIMAEKFKWQGQRAIRNRHLVYIEGAQIFDIEAIEDRYSIDNVAFLLFQHKKSIVFVSSFMFTNEKCRSNQPKVINKFDIETLTWKGKELFPAKCNNVHGCTLIGSFSGDRIAIEIVKNVARKYNFRLDTETIIDVDTDKGNDYDIVMSINQYEAINTGGLPFTWINAMVFGPPGLPI